MVIWPFTKKPGPFGESTTDQKVLLDITSSHLCEAQHYIFSYEHWCLIDRGKKYTYI